MDNVKLISPFTFISWKEDENSIVVGTKDTSFGYVALMQIDSINIDEIVDHAKSLCGQKDWQIDFAKKFPLYVVAVAAQKGIPCFATTKHASIEYYDLQTNEVLETELEATEDAYNEAVRIEAARTEYDRLQNQEKRRNPSTETLGNTERAVRNANDSSASEEDPYEDVDEDKEKDADDSKQLMLDMICTQIHAALSIGVELGLSLEEIKGVYSAALDSSQVPKTLDECMSAAKSNPALMKYLTDIQRGDQERCQHQ